VLCTYSQTRASTRDFVRPRVLASWGVGSSSDTGDGRPHGSAPSFCFEERTREAVPDGEGLFRVHPPSAAPNVGVSVGLPGIAGAPPCPEMSGFARLTVPVEPGSNQWRPCRCGRFYGFSCLQSWCKKGL
jgi:hypothetical protein